MTACQIVVVNRRLHQLRFAACDFPDFGACRNVLLGKGLVYAKANFLAARHEKVKAVEVSPDRGPIGASQFELVTLFQVRLLSHCERHRWSEVKRSVLELECLGDNDE